MTIIFALMVLLVILQAGSDWKWSVVLNIDCTGLVGGVRGWFVRVKGMTDSLTF